MTTVSVHAGFNGYDRYIVRLLINDRVEQVWDEHEPRAFKTLDPLMPPRGPWVSAVGEP